MELPSVARVFYHPSPSSHRPLQLIWSVLFSAILAVLAVLINAHRPISASAPPPTRDAQYPISNIQYPTPALAPRRSAGASVPNIQPWHTIYLPFVTQQESPTPRLYRLTIAQTDLDWLYANPRTYDTVPAVFSYHGTTYDVQVRFRGGTARDYPKKSWKIDFPARTPFEGQRELNLNAEYTDKSLLREALAYDLFERAGLLASRTRFVRLEINGNYQGLFLQVEQVDQRFLDRIGWDPNGDLFKGNYGNFEESSDYVTYQKEYVRKTNREDNHDDLVAFIEMINRTPEADFPAALVSVVDVGQYLDWVAVHILLGDFEWLEKNYYLYRQLKEGWWAFVPWDLDLLLGHNWHWGRDQMLDPDISWDNPIDSGTEWSKKTDGKWNKLITEVLRNEDFKFAYCRRLWELMNDEFAVEVMFQRIDAFYWPIIPYAEADPHKWGSNAEFHYGPTELKIYVANRLAWLTDQMPGYCPTSGPTPLLNELMSDNITTLADEAGEYEPWIELYNPGLVSFDVGGMGIRPILSGTVVPQWTIPAGTVIPPGGFLLIWADGEPGEGPLHASFRLDAGGGTVVLFDKAVHGNQVVDEKSYGPLTPDVSFGRSSDGDEAWITFDAATPGWSNLGRAPLITGTAHTPAEPDHGQPVSVSADVGDETLGPSVSLYWAADGVPQVSPMYDDGAHGDGTAGDGRYGAVLPALSAGTPVTYYLRAEDSVGLVRTDPPRAPAVTHGYLVGFRRPPLYLNELVAINRDTLGDEAGESDDWFEIYNAGLTPVDLGGMYLTDAIQNRSKWQIPPGVIVPPGAYVVFWADGQPEQGPTHVNFKLDGDGERLALYAGSDGYHGLIDEVYYGPQTVDQPWGRYPDGGATWRALIPTPGQPNRQPPPVISDLGHLPLSPAPGLPVTVSARIHDDGAVVSATLHYSAGLGFQVVPLQPITGDLYSAFIPSQAEGVVVNYYVQARDDLGEVTTYPADAPAVTYGYRVGYTPPPLYINEFLASNDAVNQDETGAYEDWVELYNAGETPLEVGGMYMSDDLSQPTKWRFPDGTVIPPGGFLLIWTDDDEQDGPLHTGFKLSKLGEEIGLFDRDAAANALIDSVVFGPQTTDVSTGRSPDGGERWTAFESPTPGENNTPF